MLWKRQHPGRIPQSPERLCMNKTALRCISGGAQHCKAVREAVSVQPALTGLRRCSSCVSALPPVQPAPRKKGEKKKKTMEIQRRVGHTPPCLQRLAGKLDSISPAWPRFRPGLFLLFKSSRLYSGRQVQYVTVEAKGVRRRCKKRGWKFVPRKKQCKHKPSRG